MSFWITDAILSVSCFIGFTQLIARPNSSAKLAAVALGLLSLASLVGTLKFAFDLTGVWPELHELASRLFGISGLYLLTLAWLDFAGILRVRLPFTFVHLADAALIFIVSRWLNLETNAQLVIGLLMNLAALASAWLLWKHQARLAFVIGLGAIVFLLNGLLIGGAQTVLFASIYRIDIFHLLLAAWTISITWVFKHSASHSAKWTLL